MNVDDLIEKLNWEEHRMIKTRFIGEEITSQEP
jgi:hypothetical protein